MSDDEIINNEEQQEQEQEPEKKPARSDNRFKDLSEKVELTAKERDEAAAKAASLEKELEFHKSFSKLKYPNAVEYQEKIKEKVMAGYDMEDAAISVLAKAGKLNSAQAQKESPMGGSAANTMSEGGEKPVAEMSTAEKREALEQIERESPGSLTRILKTTNL